MGPPWTVVIFILIVVKEAGEVRRCTAESGHERARDASVRTGQLGLVSTAHAAGGSGFRGQSPPGMLLNAENLKKAYLSCEHMHIPNCMRDLKLPLRREAHADSSGALASHAPMVSAGVLRACAQPPPPVGRPGHRRALRRVRQIGASRHLRLFRSHRAFAASRPAPPHDSRHWRRAPGPYGDGAPPLVARQRRWRSPRRWVKATTSCSSSPVLEILTATPDAEVAPMPQLPEVSLQQPPGAATTLHATRREGLLPRMGMQHHRPDIDIMAASRTAPGVPRRYLWPATQDPGCFWLATENPRGWGQVGPGGLDVRLITYDVGLHNVVLESMQLFCVDGAAFSVLRLQHVLSRSRNIFR